MTRNQIAYQELLEMSRHNRVTESLLPSQIYANYASGNLASANTRYREAEIAAGLPQLQAANLQTQRDKMQAEIGLLGVETEKTKSEVGLIGAQTQKAESETTLNQIRAVGTKFQAVSAYYDAKAAKRHDYQSQLTFGTDTANKLASSINGFLEAGQRTGKDLSKSLLGFSGEEILNMFSKAFKGGAGEMVFEGLMGL